VKDIDTALTTFRVVDNPLCGPSRPAGFKPGINHKMRDRQDPSRPGDLSNSGRNDSERRTKPRQRMARFTDRVADRLIAPGKIQSEFFDVPQIGKSMVKGVVDEKMPGTGNRASLCRPSRDLATNQTEACFDVEFVQDSQQVVGDLSGGPIVEGEQALPRY
jgi:hypothetical protein